MSRKDIVNVPVVIEKVSFKRATMLIPETDLIFYVSILKQTGNFEISESGSVLVTGSIKKLENSSTYFEDFQEEESSGSIILTKMEFYKELLLKRYNYQNLFRRIKTYDVIKQKLEIEWSGKFDSFLDCMLQINVLRLCNNFDMFLPTYLEKLVIDPTIFLNNISNGNKTF